MRHRLADLRAAVNNALVIDDDILSTETKRKLTEIEAGAEEVKNSGPNEISRFLESAEKHLDVLIPAKSSMYTILDLIAVAGVVACGIRALYLQPFKIPTSSMQPTLFGIHYIDRKESEPFTSPITKFYRSTLGAKADVTVKGDGGELSKMYQKHTKYLFWPESTIYIGSRQYTVPGDFYTDIRRYLDGNTDSLSPGEKLCDGYVSSGDHLFVERLSIHFRKLKRGDVIVFNTENISSPTQELGGYYYIKRLVGLPGDTLKIEDNRLMIKPKGESEFKCADEFSDKFKKIYSFKGGYQGHKADGILADGRVITVPENCYFAMGDNTNHSLDGRNWGFVPRRNIVGLAMNVFWPISRRWGLVDTNEPLEIPTVMPPDPRQQPSAMRLQ